MEPSNFKYFNVGTNYVITKIFLPEIIRLQLENIQNQKLQMRKYSKLMFPTEKYSKLDTYNWKILKIGEDSSNCKIHQIECFQEKNIPNRKLQIRKYSKLYASNWKIFQIGCLHLQNIKNDIFSY